MAEAAELETEVYIVHTEKADVPLKQSESDHLGTLASVVGGEEAAKSAMLYTYNHAMHGFSAKLTAEQAEAISKKPGVLQVTRNQKYQLHGNASTGLASTGGTGSALH